MAKGRTLFTGEQAAAITAAIDVDAGVTAPPGSGKTATAAGRVAYLLAKGGLEPRAIVCVTYTESAAAILKRRIATLVREKCGSEVTGLVDLQVGTFHSIALEWLRRFMPRYARHAVLPEAQRRLFVRKHFAEIGVGHVERREGSGKRARTLRLTEEPHDIRVFLDACDLIRSECIPSERLPAGLRAAHDAYLALLARHRYLDYAQILVATRDALNDGQDADCLALQRYLSGTVRQVLVDEYQDVAPLLVRTLARLHDLGPRLWVVGDARQAIMGFNGGDPRSLSHFFRRFEGAAAFRLTKNFRSSPQILDAAATLLPSMGGDPSATSREDGRGGTSAAMRAAGHHASERGDLAAVVLPTVEAQDAWGAARLRAMHGTPFADQRGDTAAPRGLRWSDMAVLVRRRDTARRIAASLRNQGLPVFIHGAENLLESPEANAIATLYEYLAGTVDANQARAAVREAALGLSDPAIDGGLAHLDGVRSAAEEASDEVFCLIRTMYDALGAMGFDEYHIPGPTTPISVGDGGDGLAATGAGVRNSKGADKALRDARRDLVMVNMGRVLRAVTDYQTINHLLAPPPRKFADFVTWLRHQAPQDYAEGGIASNDGSGGSGGSDGVGGITPDAVHILTLHRAKATEYPVVWMPDVSDGELPIKTWPERARVWGVLPRSLVTAPTRFDGTIEEEMRLAFVGLTRAMRYLFLTAPAALPKGRTVLRPASWLLRMQSRPDWVSDPDVPPPASMAQKLPALPRNVGLAATGALDGEIDEALITQTPSELLTFFNCPYQWRLRVGAGFPPPAVETLGHPESIHAALREYHARVMEGELPLTGMLPDAELQALASELVDRHHHAPYANQRLLPHLRAAASRKVREYIAEHRQRADRDGETVEAVERAIAAAVAGVNIVGRYDLSSVTADGETVLDDLKTSIKAARLDRDLLACRMYALGYEALTGRLPARVGNRVVGLGDDHYRSMAMDEAVAEDTRLRVADAGRAIALRMLPVRPAEGERTCRGCDPAALCWRGRRSSVAHGSARRV